MLGQQAFDSFQFLFDRDLRKLGQELNSYRDEQSIWFLAHDIRNSAGTLTLHLCGNLRHYIGAVLGSSGYVRDREKEFAERGVTKEQLLSTVEQARSEVLATLSRLSSDVLHQPYPEKVFDYEMTTNHFLIHLSAHLGYHLGQVNYHRRLTSKSES